MEICKNCAKPIASLEKDQIYCSYQCLKEYLSSKESVEIEQVQEQNYGKESAWMVWASIITMLMGLFGLLLILSVITDSIELSLAGFMLFSGIIIYFILKNSMPSDQFNKLLAFPKTSEIWRLIGIVLALDLFVIMPIHVVVTTLVFPDAAQQEVITMFDDASNSKIFLLAFTISILTPFAEEFLFRGFILGALLKRYTVNQSIVISSIIFAIAHEPIAMFLAFGGGLLYAWLRVKTGSIFPSMIAHAIWNGFITLVVLFY